MRPESQEIFRDLVLVGQDLRNEGSEGPDFDASGGDTFP